VYKRQRDEEETRNEFLVLDALGARDEFLDIPFEGETFMEVIDDACRDKVPAFVVAKIEALKAAVDELSDQRDKAVTELGEETFRLMAIIHKQEQPNAAVVQALAGVEAVAEFPLRAQGCLTYDAQGRCVSSCAFAPLANAVHAAQTDKEALPKDCTTCDSEGLASDGSKPCYECRGIRPGPVEFIFRKWKPRKAGRAARKERDDG